MIGSILLILVGIFTVYLCLVMIPRIRTIRLKAVYRKAFAYELMMCGLLFLLALDIRTGFLTFFPIFFLKVIGWILRIGLYAFGFAVLFFAAKILFSSLLPRKGGADHALVLGLALENGKPSRDLLLRMDTAAQYLKEYPASVLVLTGGNPDESGNTEAAVMRNLLLERGIPEDRMILEDQARSTRENFAHAANLLDPKPPIALITSSYHMDRALLTAGQAGFTHVLRYKAPSDAFPFGANVLWEILMELSGS